MVHKLVLNILMHCTLVSNGSSRQSVNLLKPTGHMMHQQFNIQQLYVLPTLYLCVLYLSENKQRLVSLTALTDWFL
jgi:hypothetical protein